MTAAQGPLDRRDSRLARVRVLLGVIAVVLLGMLVWSVFSSHDEADQARTETQSLAQQVSAACSAGGAAERELEAIGACDKAATAAAGAPPEQQPIIQVATDEQVRTAVADYLERHPPADGRTPTAAEVDAAVTRVCEAIGCRGADGTNGTNGADGTNGNDGADASPEQVAAQVATYCGQNHGCLPTAEEIQAAVVAYCSPNPSPCVGPAGPAGPVGPVLPEYYETVPSALGPIRRHCVRQGDTLPPDYNCTQE